MAALVDKFSCAKTEQVQAHLDDIHAILPLQDETFVTGSKDGCLKKWDWQGKLVRTIYDPEIIDYHSWITALSNLGNYLWLSGTRDGYIHLWDVRGVQIEQIAGPCQTREKLRCKARNVERINALADFTFAAKEKRFLSAEPTQFCLFEKQPFEKTSICKTSQHDWVYALHPLEPHKTLAVTGGRLDLLKESEKGWSSQTLIKEGPKIDGQRSFFSAITQLRGQPGLFGLSAFNGFTMIYNLEVQKIVTVRQEHQKRVWTIENLDENTFASCADDGWIKIWDSRIVQKSLASFRHNSKYPARVSVLLCPKQHLLISGACPDAVKETDEKATLAFWDLRKK